MSEKELDRRPGRYITIFEDGSMQFYKNRVPEEILRAADDGLYDVLDISDPSCPMLYMDEKWTTVDEPEDQT